MSAQVIAALRKRAAQLEDEAHERLTAQPAPGEVMLASKVRSPEHLMVLAAEFTALADLAEGGQDGQPAICPKCGTTGCVEDAQSGWYDSGEGVGDGSHSDSG